MRADVGKEHSYQWMMRALGAFLDDEPSCRLTIVETPGGFLVRMQRALHKLEPVVVRFERDTLIANLEERAKRRPSVPVRYHHQGVWAHFPNGHQDFLRALGYELDAAQARDILIDEIEDGIVLMYSAAGPGGSWERRMTTLGRSDIEHILNEAFARRGKGVPAT